MDASEIILRNSINAKDGETIASLSQLGSTEAEVILSAGARLLTNSANRPELNLAYTSQHYGVCRHCDNLWFPP